jgi:DNA invertase Pin-like site-specific DNA recombinase
MSTIGYARVSTQDQDLSAQLDALKKAGAVTIFREKVSATRGDRPQFGKLLATVKAGDTLIVCRLDRLARSLRELLVTLDHFGKAGVVFKSLGDPLFDTSTAQGRLLLAVLGAVAEFEASLIRERTSAGRIRAKANGVRFGRPFKLSTYQRAEALQRRANGETLTSIARSYGVAISMISRL